MARSSVIGIDGSRLAIGQRTGTETYTHELLSAMARIGTDDDVRVYLNAERPLLDFQLGEAVAIPFPRLWTHVRLSWEMLRRPPGVLFVPAHVVPLWHPRTVVTIHDLGYLHEPDAHRPGDRRMLDWTTRWSARTARRIVAISDATRRDLVSFYGLSPEKIVVIHHGVDRSFDRPTDQVIEDFRHRARLPERYVLAVGTVQPRKNLDVLAAAMKRVAAAGYPHWLVIAGKSGWLADEVEGRLAASGFADRIVRLGYVARGDLQALYAGADVFAFPSRYEGFGLPALEAMACGVPAVVSDRGALPEVVGSAGLVVDALDPDRLAAALVRLLNDEALRARLVDAGYQHVQRFTWDRAARDTLRLLREVRDE